MAHNLKSYVAYLHSYQMYRMKESANISEIYVTILYLKRLCNIGRYYDKLETTEEEKKR